MFQCTDFSLLNVIGKAWHWFICEDIRAISKHLIKACAISGHELNVALAVSPH